MNRLLQNERLGIFMGKKGSQLSGIWRDSVKHYLSEIS